MINMFHQCPACGGNLIITECKCARCQLQMRGEFHPGTFATLSTDQLTFIKVFLSARGNLTEMERVLGISYPTIRNKLDEINVALDQSDENKPAGDEPAVPSEEDRRSILQRVSGGQLSAAEALQKLQKSQGGKL
jgi:hypothetical protein